MKLKHKDNKLSREKEKGFELDRVLSYKAELSKVADKMAWNKDHPVLIDHLNSIIDDLEYQAIELLDGGIVTKK